MPIPLLPLDDRTYGDLVKEMRALIPRYAPEWTDHLPSDPGIMLLELFSWLTEMLIYRENRITDASRRHFVELLGFPLKPAQAATVQLRVTATGLSDKLILPPGTPLLAKKTGREQPLPFETVKELVLVPAVPISLVMARQTSFVVEERIGTGTGEPNQIYRLKEHLEEYVFFDDESSRSDLKAKVGDAEWTYQPSLWKCPPKPKNPQAQSNDLGCNIFTIDTLRNAICFGAGGQQVKIPPAASKPSASAGAIPPKGVPILISYHVTIGKDGNLPKDIDYELDTGSRHLAQEVRNASLHGVELFFKATSGASGGQNPSTFEDAYSEIVRDLDASWRSVTSKDFERIVLEQRTINKNVNVVRASCLPDQNMEARASGARAPGHVSVMIVPGRPPEPWASPYPPAHDKNTTKNEGSGAKPPLSEYVRISPDGKRHFLLYRGDKCLSVVNIALWPVFDRAIPISYRRTKLQIGPNHKRLALLHRGDKLQISPDGKRLALLHRGDKLQISPDGKRLALLHRHDKLRINPDSKQLTLLHRVDKLQIWSAENGEQMVELPEITPVTCVIFSPDGRLLAWASADNIVRLWDMKEKRLSGAPLFAGEGLVTCLAFSHDSRRIAAGTRNGDLLQWDLEKRQQLIPPISTVTPPQEADETMKCCWQQINCGVLSVAFSPDGKMLAFGTEAFTPPVAKEPASMIRCWGVQSQELLDPIFTTDKGVQGLAFGLDSTVLAAACGDGIVRLWDVKSLCNKDYKPLELPKRHTDSVTAVAFGPDGATLASASKDGTIGLWDVLRPKGEPIKGQFIQFIQFKNAENKSVLVTGIAFDPDGNTLAAGGADGPVKLWDLKKARETGPKCQPAITFNKHKDVINSVAFYSNDEIKVMASGSRDGTFKVWDVETGNDVANCVSHGDRRLTVPTCASFSPDGRWFTVVVDENAVQVWDVLSRRQVAELCHEEPIRAIAFRPDGRWLVTAGDDRATRIWEVETWALFACLEHEAPIVAVMFSPDGRQFVTLGKDGKDGIVELWTSDRRQRVAELRHKQLEVAILSPRDGRWLATFGQNPPLRILDTKTGRLATLESTYPERPKRITRAAFRPNGRRLVTCTEDGVFGYWGLDSDDLKWSQYHEFDPNGDTKTGRLATLESTYPERPQRITRAAFRPNRRRLVTRTEDGVFGYWRLDSDDLKGSQYHEFDPNGEANAVQNSLVFWPSPDLRWLIVVKRDEDPEHPQIWDLDTHEPVAALHLDTGLERIEFSEDGRLVATVSGQFLLAVGDEHKEDLERKHLSPNLKQTFKNNNWPLSSEAVVKKVDQGWQIQDQNQSCFISRRQVFSPGRAEAPDGGPLLAWTRVVQVWDVQSGRQLAVLGYNDVDYMQFVAGGSRLVTVGRSSNWTTATDGRSSSKLAAQVWEADYVRSTYEHLNERRLIATRHHVVGATYTDVRVKAEVVCQNRIDKERLGRQIEENLRAFFDPLQGGPDSKKSGWPYGRDVYASEFYQVIENTAGVDRVDSLTLMTLKAPPESPSDSKAPPTPADSSESSHSILDRLLVWEDATDNHVNVALNDLVHLTVKPGDITLRTTRSSR